MKYNAQQFKFYLQTNDTKFLQNFLVNKKVRQFSRLIGQVGILETKFFIYRVNYGRNLFSKD